MRPTWLDRHLEATGRANPDGYGRAVRAGICNTCFTRVLRGLDGERAAIPVDVDPEPVSTVGELLAVLNGAQTYNLCNPAKPELCHRSALHIGTRRYPVLAEHRCGTEWPVDEDASPHRTHPPRKVPF